MTTTIKKINFLGLSLSISRIKKESPYNNSYNVSNTGISKDRIIAQKKAAIEELEQNILLMNVRLKEITGFSSEDFERKYRIERSLLKDKEKCFVLKNEIDELSLNADELRHVLAQERLRLSGKVNQVRDEMKMHDIVYETRIEELKLKVAELEKQLNPTPSTDESLSHG